MFSWTVRRAGSQRPQIRSRFSYPILTSIGITILGVFYLFYTFVYPHLLRFRFRSDLSLYDLGLYGFGPSKGYVSFDLESPVLETTEWADGCEDGQLTFLAPRGDSVAYPGPMILDPKGDLVWTRHNSGGTQNFKVQQYRGEDYLTFWGGGNTDGHSEGRYYMLDSSYTQRFEISPVGYSGGDLHEFYITDDNTALVTIYHPVLTDLTSVGGPEIGWIHDGVFQEIDIESGELLFEWRASDHFPVNATYETLKNAGKNRQSGFDFFHINSVDKDEEGNYIVSSRHFHTVFLVDRDSGAIKWTLGGKLNEFTDLSNGEATDFSWQHDARWHGNGTLTLFDNSAHGNNDPWKPSRGMVIHLDVSARTATLQGAYYHPQDMKSVSQGNVQILDNGNIFVGWGHSAAYTEFSREGQPLCNVHYGASAYFTFGRIVSYRITKGDWVGRPDTLPDAEVIDDDIYVSWNGATEVATWQLEAWDLQDLDTMTFDAIATYDKDGFETVLEIPEYMNSPYFRIAALDADGEVLGFTDVLQRDEGFSLADIPMQYWVIAIVFGVSGVGLALGVCRCSRCCRRRPDEYHLVAINETEVSSV